MINWKGFEKSGRDLILRNDLSIRLEGLSKITKISVMIAGLRAEILTRDLPNAKEW
jgi:hypothetical protein